MRRIPKFLAAAVPLLLTGLVPLAPSASAATPTCAAVSVPAPAGAKIESVTAEHKTAYCQITVTLTHDGSDHVKVAVALPDTGWTGRLQALGGSAYAAGNFDGLAQAVKDGYTGVSAPTP